MKYLPAVESIERLDGWKNISFPDGHQTALTGKGRVRCDRIAGFIHNRYNTQTAHA